MKGFWRALEQVSGLNAVTAAWAGLMGPAVFACARPAFFRKRPEPARAIFCESCYCAHEVVPAPPESMGGAAPLVGVCRCEMASCPDIRLTPADVEIWELNWARLGRSLCLALDLEPQPDRLSCPGTRQIGTWSSASVPVFLTIQPEPDLLRWSISELVARLQSPFIVLVPTAVSLGASCRELLAHARAGFLALDTAVQLTERASFRPAQPPPQLFAEFRPQPDEAFERATARNAMALIEKLNDGDAPTPLQAFQRYCVKGWNEREIAEEFGVAESTVSRRLRRVRLATGQTLAALRGLKPFYEVQEEE